MLYKFLECSHIKETGTRKGKGKLDNLCDLVSEATLIPYTC